MLRRLTLRLRRASPDTAALMASPDDGFLSVRLIDLRAELESQLRDLTKLQREVEIYRAAGAASRREIRVRIRQLARRLVEGNAAIRDAIASVAEQLTTLR
jgi:hypothetical protein